MVGLEPIGVAFQESCDKLDLVSAVGRLQVVNVVIGFVGKLRVLALAIEILGADLHGLKWGRQRLEMDFQILVVWILDSILQGSQPVIRVFVFLYAPSARGCTKRGNAAVRVGAENNAHLFFVGRPEAGSFGLVCRHVALPQIEPCQQEAIVRRRVGSLHEFFHFRDGVAERFLARVRHEELDFQPSVLGRGCAAGKVFVQQRQGLAAVLKVVTLEQHGQVSRAEQVSISVAGGCSERIFRSQGSASAAFFLRT